MIIDAISTPDEALPADDPQKLRLGWYIFESPWMFCVGFGETCWIHKNGAVIYTNDLPLLAQSYDLDVETFKRLLLDGQLNDDRVQFHLDRIRDNSENVKNP